MSKTLVLAALAAAAIASLGTLPTAARAAQLSVMIGIAPPAPRVVVMPPPRPGYLWAPGYWNWRGNRHVWQEGSWMRERPGYAYAPPHWVQHDNRWELNRGGWAHADHDRDGVPNGQDRHPDNAHRP
jgi:hypothetical protein